MKAGSANPPSQTRESKDELNRAEIFKSDDECEEKLEGVDENTLIEEKKLIDNDLLAKFERYTKLTKNIPDYKEQQQNLMPAGIKDPEEIKQIHDKFHIDFDPDQVTKIIKRGREQLSDRRIEYTRKKEELEAKWRAMSEEDKEVKQKTDNHQQRVDSIEKFKAELVMSQAEIIDLRTNCDSDKTNFATKYATYKQEINELKNTEKRVNTRISKQKAIVETCNDLIKNYKAQNKGDRQNIEYKQKEESRENKKFLDTLADSIFKDSYKVKDYCEKVKTSITNMIINKNKEIQNAKDDSDKEKNKLDQKIKESNNTKDEGLASLKTISLKVKAIDKDIEDCKDTQLSQRIDAAYDYTKLILEPFKSIQTKDLELNQPKFSFIEFDRAKQIREAEFKALAEVQSDLRELMVQGEEDSKVRVKMQEIQSQIEIRKQTIKDSGVKINEWNSKLEKKKEEKVDLEKEIDNNDANVISACSEELKQFLITEENRLKERESTIQSANDTLLKNKCTILEKIAESKLALAETELKLETKMNESCVVSLNTFCKYYSKAAKDFYTLKDLKNLSEHADLQILSKYAPVYYKIKDFVHNKKSVDKTDFLWNCKIAIEEIACEFENDLSAILDEIEKGGYDQTLNSEIFSSIQNQKDIVISNEESLNECKLEKIDDPLKINSTKSIFKKLINDLKESKQKNEEKLTKLIQIIQNLEDNISYAQGEIETQQNINEKAKKEYNELNDYQNQIDCKIDEIIKKISDYLSSKLQDKSLKNKINIDLSKVKEGDFKTNNIDNWINQICIQYIGLVDEAYSKSINEYKLNFEDHVKQVEMHYQSQIKGYKEEVWRLNKQGCIEMDAINQKNIKKFDEISKNVGITLKSISKAAKDIQDQGVFAGERIKKVSDISENIKQSFNNVHNKLASISDIVDESPWDSLSTKIGELIEKSDDNKKVVENLFKHLEDEAKRKQDKIDSNKETLKETRKNIDKKVNKLTKLKGIGEYRDRKSGKDGVLNREQIKSKIVDVNSAIQSFNKNIEKYEQKLNECIESKKELNSLEVQLHTKRDKIQEMEENHTNVRAKLEAKYQEFRDIADKIKKMDVFTYEYKNCNIIVRKNDLTLELSEAIVNPANEQLMHEGGAARVIADKGGDIIWEESKQYIRKNGNLSTGQATMTNAGNLPCKYVIHVVGPRYNKNLPDNSLAHAQMKMATNSIMEIVNKENIDSVSIPAISTGIFGFPVIKAASIIGNTVKSFIDSNSSEMRDKTIVFCNFDDPTVDTFKQIIPGCFSPKAKEEKDEEEDDNEETKQVESEEEDQTDLVEICKHCKKPIDETKHQSKGKHLNICYKCYKKKKDKKRKEKEREEEEEESEEDIETKKKKLKKKYKAAKNESDQESEEVETSKKNNKKKDDSDDEEDESSKAKKDRNKKKNKNKNKKNKDDESDNQDSSKDNESQDESRSKPKNSKVKDSKKKAREDKSSDSDNSEEKKDSKKGKESKNKKNKYANDDLTGSKSNNKNSKAKTRKRKSE